MSVAISVVAQMVSPFGRHRDRRVQRMGLAAQIEQLPPRGLHGLGLRQDLIAESEHLVGADDIGLAGKIAHGLRLGARQHLGDVMGPERPLPADGLAHDALVQSRRLDDERKPRRFEDPRADLAR